MVEIGLTDLPKSGGAMEPLTPEYQAVTKEAPRSNFKSLLFLSMLVHNNESKFQNTYFLLANIQIWIYFHVLT